MKIKIVQNDIFFCHGDNKDNGQQLTTTMDNLYSDDDDNGDDEGNISPNNSKQLDIIAKISQPFSLPR